MKIKLDENIPAEFAAIARRLGHDCETVHSEGLAGRDDATIAAAATREGRFLVAKDLDFSDVRPRAGMSGFLILRAHDAGRAAILAMLTRAFETEPVESWAGCMVVLAPGRLRVRRLE